MKTTKPFAVVLDLDFSGYGAVRSLISYGVPVIGFFNSNKYIPEQRTRLCYKKVKYSSESELLKKLVFIGKTYKRPVLILTSDYYVLLIKKYYNLIRPFYKINFPSTETIDHLMDKAAFSKFAQKHQIKVPKTGVIDNRTKFRQISKNFTFPTIVKPLNRSKNWVKAGLPKAFMCNNTGEVFAAWKASSFIENNLLVQEYIPGNDWDIYYCLSYFNEKSECLAAFTGRKLRQWPVLTGSTATTAPIINEYLEKESIRILKLAGLIGFGSVEFKKHLFNGGYYVIEPTVGRINQQEYVATANGVNIPITAYFDMLQSNPPTKQNSTKPVIYIDEIAEAASAVTHFKRNDLEVYNWILSFKGFKRCYRYFNAIDPNVFLGLLLDTIKKVFARAALTFRGHLSSLIKSH
jgi:predicted ATP-grasp superfamily ATP-dependent carboligase